MSDPRLETLKKLDLQPGDILHVKVGGDLGDGAPPWIPTQDEIEGMFHVYKHIIPNGVDIIVTHHMVDEQVIRRVSSDVTHWPPRQP